MSYLSENMRYLRAQLSCSQQKIADDLVITRGRYAKYEDGASEPPLEILLKISRYFHVSIDLLVSVDISSIPLRELQQLPDNRILLPIKVDTHGENRIEIVPHKAQMGYLRGYSDPEYIESLQHISLPFLSRAKYRAFPGDGDSMPPHTNDSIIIGRYIENLAELKEDKTYVFITHEGITYKRLTKKNKTSLLVSADNPFFAPFEIEMVNLFEVWEYAASITTYEYKPEDNNPQSVKSMFEDIKRELLKLKYRE
jgi:transcriptional regulator with XRE-family HTH domain